MIDKAIESGDLTASKVYELWKAKQLKKKRAKDPLRPKKVTAPQNDLVVAIQKRVWHGVRN